MKQASNRWGMLFCAVVGLGVFGMNLSGCRTANSSSDAMVRLINASPETQELAVAVDGKRVWRHSLFRSNTGYGGVGAGTYKVAMEARRDNRLVSGDGYFNCQKGKAYTVLALGNSSGAPTLRIFSEDEDAPVPSGKVRVRYVNATSGGSGQTDVLFNNIVGLMDVAYGRRSSALILEPGTYDVKVNAAGDATTMVGPINLRLREGHAYTLVAMGRADATDPQQGLSLELYPDDHSASDQ